MMVSRSSDDDGLAVPPSLRATTPPQSMPARAEMHKRRWTREAAATMPNNTRAAPTAAAQVAPSMTTRTATAVPETTRTTPVAVAQATTVVLETTRATLVATMETPGGLATGQTGSRWGRMFRAR